MKRLKLFNILSELFFNTHRGGKQACGDITRSMQRAIGDRKRDELRFTIKKKKKISKREINGK